jgi:MFS family permease
MHSSSSIAWIGTLEAMLCFEVAIVSGVAYDLGYWRALLFGGTFLMVFGMMMLSLSTQFWQVILSQGLCLGLGGGILYVPSIALVVSSFEESRRAIPLGIISSGGAVGTSHHKY